MTEPTAPGAVVPSVPLARMAHAFSIQLICRPLGMPASVVSVAMTARYLGPGRYGLLSIAMLFIAIWTSLADLSIATVIVRLVRINGGLAIVYCVLTSSTVGVTTSDMLTPAMLSIPCFRRRIR